MSATATRAGSVSLALTLLWLTIVWNSVEGVVALASSAASGSVALLGFGFDSFIEVAAAGVLVWRLGLREDGPAADAREQSARRLIGVSFLVLACVVAAQSAYVLVAGSEPTESVPGLVLSVASFVVMPALGLAKRRNATALHSHALIAESSETLVCSYLSLTLFIGLGANAAFGWWWADIAAAMAMVPWIVKEGVEGLRGDPCGEDCP